METSEPDVLHQIVEIAKTVPMIKRIWFFGSRFKGTASCSSDLDLAIEVEWVSGKMLGTCEVAFSLWCAVTPYFEERMAEVCPWPLDLQNYVDEQVTPSVAEYIRCSQLIYERNA
jgi:hypothetical protein